MPDVAIGRLTLSSLIVKEADPEAPLATPDHPEGQVAEPNPQGSAAVRIFPKGAAIVYGYQVLNAQTDSEKKPQLEAQTRLFLDGKQVYEGKPAALVSLGQPDPKMLITAGSMKLGSQIASGDYVLQVIVTDKLAKDKYRTATQWMDFEIEP